MGTSRCTVVGGVGGDGEVETAVLRCRAAAQQDFIGVLEPEDVQTHTRKERPAGVLAVHHLTDHVERLTGGHVGGHVDDLDGAVDLNGHVHNGHVAVSTGVTVSERCGQVVLHHHAHVVVTGSDAIGDIGQAGVSLGVGRGCSKAGVGTAVIPDVFHRDPGNVRTVGHIGHFGEEIHRGVHFNDVRWSFRRHHRVRDDTAKGGDQRWRSRGYRRIHVGIVGPTFGCLGKEIQVQNEVIRARGKVRWHRDGDAEGTGGVVQRGKRQVNEPVIGFEGDGDQGVVVQHRCVVNGIEQVARQGRGVAHVGPILGDGEVVIDFCLDANGAAGGRRLVVIRAVEACAKWIITGSQGGGQGKRQVNGVGARVNRGVEPRPVEREIVIAQGVGHGAHAAMIEQIHTNAGVKASQLGSFFNDHGQFATKEVGFTAGHVGVVGGREAEREEPHPHLDLTRSHHGGVREEILEGEGSCHGLVEDFRPHVTQVKGPNGQLDVAGQGGGRCTEGLRRAVDPHVVIEQENAVVGQRSFHRRCQVRRIGHVDDDAVRGGQEVELRQGDATHRRVLPSGEAKGGREVGLCLEFAEVEGDGPEPCRVGRGREVLCAVHRGGERQPHRLVGQAGEIAVGHVFERKRPLQHRGSAGTSDGGINGSRGGMGDGGVVGQVDVGVVHNAAVGHVARLEMLDHDVVHPRCSGLIGEATEREGAVGIGHVLVKLTLNHATRTGHQGGLVHGCEVGLDANVGGRGAVFGVAELTRDDDFLVDVAREGQGRNRLVGHLHFFGGRARVESNPTQVGAPVGRVLFQANLRPCGSVVGVDGVTGS